MRITSTEIEDVKIIEPDVYGDERGWFVEQYNSDRYKEAGIFTDFVQDNESYSFKGVVRGLHWQDAPYTQAKLVRVIQGAVWDVVVDIRKGSPNFGKHVSCVLSGANKRQFFIPKGFAHGFVVLEDKTIFSYKCDCVYHKESEQGIMFDDPSLGIVWPKLDVPIILSDKDKRHPLLSEIEPWVG